MSDNSSFYERFVPKYLNIKKFTPMTNDLVSSNSKPKLPSTRKGKAIAAGGALATAGALGGAYAYKKHLDKKRQESENAKASTTDR